jgi:hypothetical protein
VDAIMRIALLEVLLRVLKNKYLEKKEQGGKPCSKNCVDPISPKNLDLILIDGATLLVRVRAPPETWTTRLQPPASLSLKW